MAGRRLSNAVPSAKASSPTETVIGTLNRFFFFRAGQRPHTFPGPVVRVRRPLARGYYKHPSGRPGSAPKSPSVAAYRHHCLSLSKAAEAVCFSA